MLAPLILIAAQAAPVVTAPLPLPSVDEVVAATRICAQAVSAAGADPAKLGPLGWRATPVDGIPLPPDARTYVARPAELVIVLREIADPMQQGCGVIARLTPVERAADDVAAALTAAFGAGPVAAAGGSRMWRNGEHFVQLMASGPAANGGVVISVVHQSTTRR